MSGEYDFSYGKTRPEPGGEQTMNFYLGGNHTPEGHEPTRNPRSMQLSGAMIVLGEDRHTRFSQLKTWLPGQPEPAVIEPGHWTILAGTMGGIELHRVYEGAKDGLLGDWILFHSKDRSRTIDEVAALIMVAELELA